MVSALIVSVYRLGSGCFSPLTTGCCWQWRGAFLSSGGSCGVLCSTFSLSIPQRCLISGIRVFLCLLLYRVSLADPPFSTRSQFFSWLEHCCRSLSLCILPVPSGRIVGGVDSGSSFQGAVEPAPSYQGIYSCFVSGDEGV